MRQKDGNIFKYQSNYQSQMLFSSRKSFTLKPYLVIIVTNGYCKISLPKYGHKNLQFNPKYKKRREIIYVFFSKKYNKIKINI